MQRGNWSTAAEILAMCRPQRPLSRISQHDSLFLRTRRSRGDIGDSSPLSGMFLPLRVPGPGLPLSQQLLAWPSASITQVNYKTLHLSTVQHKSCVPVSVGRPLKPLHQPCVAGIRSILVWSPTPYIIAPSCHPRDSSRAPCIALLLCSGHRRGVSCGLFHCFCSGRV